jgi:hypothetical protein
VIEQHGPLVGTETALLQSVACRLTSPSLSEEQSIQKERHTRPVDSYEVKCAADSVTRVNIGIRAAIGRFKVPQVPFGILLKPITKTAK